MMIIIADRLTRLISERSCRACNLYIQNIAVSRLISERGLSARAAELREKGKKKNEEETPSFPWAFRVTRLGRSKSFLGKNVVSPLTRSTVARGEKSRLAIRFPGWIPPRYRFSNEYPITNDPSVINRRKKPFPATNTLSKSRPVRPTSD